MLIDIFYSNLFGFYSLVYMYIGYMTGLLYNVYYDDDVKGAYGTGRHKRSGLWLSDLGTQFLLRGRIHFLGLPQPHHHSRGRRPTTLMTLLLYRILYALNRRFSDSREGERDTAAWLGR